MKFTTLRFLALLLGAMLLLNSCKQDIATFPDSADQYSSELAREWMALSLRLVKTTPGFTPPVAARAYGYAGITMYEAVVHGMPARRSLAGIVNGLNAADLPQPEAGAAYHWGIVANAAAREMFHALFANTSAANKARIDSMYGVFNVRFAAVSDDAAFERSVEFGELVGAAMVAYAASDGQMAAYASNFPASYLPPSGPGLWRPTPPAFQKALQPYWGDVRPFVSSHISGSQPMAPPPFSTDPSSVFYQEAMAVYDAVSSLTPEQRIIAQFWSDDPGLTATPPGHSISILNQLIVREKKDLAFAAEAYARMGMAVHDAFIACWKCKYDYNLLRPVTYIQDHIDPGFMPILNTPPFPEYTSGHSSQSGACAEVFKGLFGESYAFTDYTHAKRTDINGAPRSFSNFDQYAREAADSRLYGGIHYPMGNDKGLEMGKFIGTEIRNLNLNK